MAATLSLFSPTVRRRDLATIRAALRVSVVGDMGLVQDVRLRNTTG